MERRKPGRPSKGPRRLVQVKLPIPLAAAAQDYAARRGMTLTDLVGELLAAETGQPYQSQEALPRTA